MKKEKTTHNLKGCQCPKGSDIRFCLGKEAVPSWEDNKIFKALYLLADEKVIDDVVDRFKELISQTIKAERAEAVKEERDKYKKEFDKWFSNGTELVEDAIERIFKIK